MDEVGTYHPGGETWDDVGEQDYTLANQRTEKAQSSREDDYVEGIVDEAKKPVRVLDRSRSLHTYYGRARTQSPLSGLHVQRQI